VEAHPHLLIVEHDPAIADLFVLALSEEGYGVDAVLTPEDALDRLNEHGREHYSVVLSNPFSDHRREQYAWLDRIVERTTGAVVICSRHPATFFSDHRARGFAAFLQEPFNLQDLVNLVASLTNGHGE